MTRVRISLTITAVVGCTIGLASCQKGQNGERGGEPEQQLLLATVAGDVARVKQLLATGADPNKMALYEGRYQSSWKLAVWRARPDHKDSTEIVRAMLASHANPEAAFGEEPSRSGGVYTEQSQPILDAVSNSADDVVRALLESGLDPRRGQLPLVLAVENGQTEIVHILVEAGVDVNCQPSANTPLIAAIETRNVTLMTYLEEHGARERP
jgi:hypothetical protein